MGLFVGDELKKVIAQLEERGALLYHACQAKDFVSYLEIGGVPSRGLLKSSGKQFTAFDTDKNDQDNQVWNLVFLNLEDFGNSFANGRLCTPTAYGPINLALRPKCLSECSDVAICLKSAGSSNFDRTAESIDNIEDFSKLFVFPPDEAKKGKRRWIEVQANLQRNFPGKNNSSRPELSCTHPNSYISLVHVAYAIIDPYDFLDSSLTKFVEQKRAEYGYDFRCCTRGTDRPQAYQQLFDAISSGSDTVEKVLKISAIDPALKSWLEELSTKPFIRKQFEERYVRYLKDGTIGYLQGERMGKAG